MSAGLQGANIVVTRPAGRGESLCRQIEAAGGDALHFPTIEIRPVDPPSPPETAPDWVIFTSVPGVEHGAGLLREHFTGTTRVAAIGAATASALEAAGFAVAARPERQESEGLLELAEFAEMSGRETWIVRGGNGRELLPERLRERGANVTLLEVYERAMPEVSARPLLERWRRGRLDAIVVSSRAGLENLHGMLDASGRRFLRETQLVIPTGRMLKLALDLDIRPAPLVAAGASDDALMAVLVEWWRNVH